MQIPEIRASLLGQPARRIAIDILEEDYRAMLDLFAERGLTEEEGVRLALFTGLAELRRQGEAETDEESLVKQLNRLEGAYIGMKHKAYLLALDNERMELARSGWEVELEALRRMVAQLRGQEAPAAAAPHASSPPPSPENTPPRRPDDWELEAPAHLMDDEPAAKGAGKSLWRRLTGR
ncbi:MAG: hypothetical protein RMM58_05915 [Chloroflexota bacterium]|nr:hypothetical protein [Dehalococcoidia bacterium]MDW8253397.1 hypothetical protein [Chloroflexota bacterium]